jgi:uncharacterized coiled-coil DUF342 family protein
MNKLSTLSQTSSSTAPNKNLTNIIESFKKEKTAFNERFQELKKRLDTFNSKRNSSSNSGTNSYVGLSS